MHKQQCQKHWQPCDAAARRIQRVFRGWRARIRVVHRVREGMELLVADIQRQLNGEWALLGPTASTLPSFSLDWGRSGTLRLPRMEDSLFGVSVVFPPLELEEELHDEDGSDNEALANEYEQAASQDSGLAATDGLSSQDKVMPFESSLGNAPESRPPTDDTDAQTSLCEAQAVNEAANSSDASRCDACMSAVEIRSTTLQAETSAKQQSKCQAESTDDVPRNDGNAQLASVQEILATHSRAEILSELEWERQALRDRRKYLRSKRRVERGPDLACA
ncbi:hypothetical protein GN958_ATG18245 [Phytophthora infestans]|uniref:Uncharacterized protein n=1 Tax=Phytophthora infestans TaxID=4787 RepID=A0A8S9TWY9_PHYIN|nr:hypothetical protein GN958_ATG18245 [Phytophthora infestans]